jgi:lysine 2,3-aminomutase
MADNGRTIKTIADLSQAGLAPGGDETAIAEVARRYAIAITPTIQERIGHAWDGPVGRQFVPTGRELVVTAEERHDPVGDEAFSPVRGVTHRYEDRVLLKPLQTCPVYCRFCFRREAVGPMHGVLPEADLAAALDYIRDQRVIWEVILSGGDPLMLRPARLRRIIAALDAIDHVKVIRVHTRIPVVWPDHVGEEALSALACDTPVWIVVHCNHRQEIGPEASAALRRLADRGFPLLSQTVLLKGINDDATVLEELFRALVEHRVKPYYLHHPDLAHGTSHFRIPVEAGQRIARELRGDVSGLCQPTYVLDIPGGHGKVPLAESHAERCPDGTYLVSDRTGALHRYPPAAGEAEAGVQ